MIWLTTSSSSAPIENLDPMGIHTGAISLQLRNNLQWQPPHRHSLGGSAVCCQGVIISDVQQQHGAKYVEQMSMPAEDSTCSARCSTDDGR